MQLRNAVEDFLALYYILVMSRLWFSDLYKDSANIITTLFQSRSFSPITHQATCIFKFQIKSTIDEIQAMPIFHHDSVARRPFPTQGKYTTFEKFRTFPHIPTANHLCITNKATKDLSQSENIHVHTLAADNV
jgi:hypothetical protein